MQGLLFQIVVYLAAAVIAVPLSRRLGLGAVVGYLAAGVAIGPAVLGLIHEPVAILHFSEFGVVLLLFLIGLELEPTRLWHLRHAIFGLGGSQMLVCTLVLSAVGLLGGLTPGTAVIVAFALSLSSTAMALQVLQERGLRRSEAGSMGLAVLLFQDLAVIPVLALLPLAAGAWTAGRLEPLAMLGPVLAIVIVLVGGRYATRPVFRYIAGTGQSEIFTAFALLLVAGIALLMQAVGLSMALGGFLAGVLLADSEYRQQLELEIEPFKGLLMGLFFMAVGMTIEPGLLWREPLQIGLMLTILLAVKFTLLWVVARRFGAGVHGALQFAAVLAQGGEFAFVVLDLAAGGGQVPAALARSLVLVVGLSMLATPLLLRLVEWRIRAGLRVPAPVHDNIDEQHPVILVGFGRMGQVIGRLLLANGFPLTVIDNDPEQVEVTRRFGNKVYYGDATRLDTLRAAGAGEARLLVVVCDEIAAINAIVDHARQHFPHLQLVVRARNRTHAYDLIERGVEVFERETFLSALELGRQALEALGFPPERAAGAERLFRAHDEATVQRLQAVRGDPDRLISESRRARDDLARLMREELGTPE